MFLRVLLLVGNNAYIYFMDSLAYLGVAEKYPFQPDLNSGVLLTSGYDLIQQSIADIIETPIGDRGFLEEYGSNCSLLNFMPNDAILASLLTYHISDALYKWERRIQVMTIDCKAVNTSQMNCELKYRILASNEVKTFTYPFYREIIY